MPGLVVASRRWIIGSDDLIIPGLLLLFTHLIWIIIYCIVAIKNETLFLDINCSNQLTYHVFGQLILILGCTIVELCIIKVSFRGSILNTKARKSLTYLIYIRFALFLIEVTWEAYGLFIFFYDQSIYCSLTAKEIIISLKLFDFLIWTILICVIWCSFDPAGRSWVKMKKFQDSLKDSNSKYKYRRSKNSHRNWRHREAIREYEKSWYNRCRKFCCILNLKDPRENSFAEIAKLLSEFFRDIDVVPSDVVAGLSLLRVSQKAKRQEKIADSGEDIFQFLSGVPITSETKFLDLTHPLVVKEVLNLIHYLHYSLAIYGWPMYMMANSPIQWCKLLNHTKCCGNQSGNLSSCFGANFQPHIDEDTIVDDCYIYNLKNNDFVIGDNCCLCNRAAIQQTCIDHNYKIVYITYFVAVEKPPFFVAIDYDKMSIVVSIRGTLSLYDVLTDLNAEYDILPLNPPKENWFGHKGMVAAANYIRSKLVDRQILEIANEELKSRNANPCDQYPIIIVGHSLGAGTAAILAVLLREMYSNVICFAFAPPGGLLSEEVVEYSKDFVVSVVLGKDIVPRLGLHQMEKLRFDLIQAIKECNMSKWNIIFKSCCIGKKDLSMQDFVREFNIEVSNNKDTKTSDEDEFKKLSIHPNDESISLTVHTPLYPPGSIIHLVRMHPNKADLVYEPKWRQIISKKCSIIQAVWTDNNDYNEIVISPTMIKDHMPDTMLQVLEALLESTGPLKPQRVTETGHEKNNLPNNESNSSPSSTKSEYAQQHIVVETSFTDSYNAVINDSEIYNENRLKKWKSLIRKGRAPLASPETISLASCGELERIAESKDRINKNLNNTPISNETVIEVNNCDDVTNEQSENLERINSATVTANCSSLEVKNLNKSSSDSNLKQDKFDLKYGFLKRSQEKYNLNHLDESDVIYET